MSVDSLTIASAMVMLEARNTGIFIEGPRQHNKLWLVSPVGDGEVGSLYYGRKLGTCLGKLLTQFTQEDYDVPESDNDYLITKAVTMLSRDDDAIIVSLVDSEWEFKSYNRNYYVTGRDYYDTLDAFITMVRAHLNSTVYANDNCPLD